jgi:uncharacterized protein YndB with AHSA1/START domain
MPEADAYRSSFEIGLGPALAFEVFTAGFGSWWPRQYTWSGEALEDIGIEPGVGGFCHEIGPHGLRLDWGRVLVWTEPARIAFTWQIGFDRVPVPDPERASVVEVGFEPLATGCRVDFEHRDFARHGADWKRYLAGMSQPRGWPLILERFARAAQERG